ncbi:Ppx/GppA phosphatase family protein [Castellaniella sp.]|uniref:Ppx/GppA phosphatase family protein n=1 Tax=Castellaniella sp. TaxID=1955812 RepID=UPI002AFFD579|nr:Ppx/GppA phosphatase family protein [Castellaniella sp.]
MDNRLASIDLGSNTFRLSIGRVVREGETVQVYTEDRMRELIALASGLDEHQRIRPDTVSQAIEALQRFGERLRGFDPANVRAVATNTFRVARNAAEIIPLAERALGFPIEIISGQEEARLIYLGVIQDLPPSKDRRLVIDIGGGSTEFIIGRGQTPLQLASLQLGCTTWSKQFFSRGQITKARMQRAIVAARSTIEPISRRYRHVGWQQAYGSSGTAKGLLAVLVENGFSQRDITLDGMQQLAAALIKVGQVHLQDWAGLKAERAPVLAGGLAIMIAAFLELGISHMGAGDGALRVGVLHDLLGRDSHHDQRDETVRQMGLRYQADAQQAEHVRQLALVFFDQLNLDTAHPQGAELRKALSWTAMLHEIGLAIARNHYHKHSAYVLENADMPGFSHDDQQLLAFLALGQQGKLAKLRPYAPTREQWLALCCLRLAVLLLRRREARDALPIHLQAQGQAITLSVPDGWLSDHPLSSFMLKGEIDVWRKAGFTLEIMEGTA